MKKLSLFLLLFISITLVFMTSNVFAGHSQVDLKIAKQNSQQVVAKGVKSNNPCMAKNACNPCAANPCAVNPCAANPCAVNPCAVNPCAANPCAVNPCAANPCAANPCGAKMKVKPIRSGKIKSLNDAVNLGEKLWKDTKLGSSGLSCNTCHAGGNTYTKTALQVYPHFVSMPNDVVTLDQMINFCMINPMKGDPLPYGSKEMTALSAYFQNVSLNDIEKRLGSMSANPCAAKNACNPCAVNPCGAKNACNPCAGR
ncbi:MAG: cytochrome C peroxidase [Thermodesulfobacteriota bacterium]